MLFNCKDAFISEINNLDNVKKAVVENFGTCTLPWQKEMLCGMSSEVKIHTDLSLEAVVKWRQENSWMTQIKALSSTF